jgi:hypothetical protein
MSADFSMLNQDYWIHLKIFNLIVWYIELLKRAIHSKTGFVNVKQLIQGHRTENCGRLEL